MKPIPVAKGAAAAVVVVAAVVAFLLLGGNSEPMDTAATPSATQPAGPGAEATLQVGNQADDAIGQESSGLPQQLQEQEGLPTLPWQADGLTDLGQSAGESLAAIEDAAPRAAWILVDADWLAGEITLKDSLALALIRELAEMEPSLAGQVAGLPWLADDLADEEVLALAVMGDLAEAGPETLAAVLDTGWLTDGLDEEDQFTLAILEDIAQEDPALARRMAGSPDLADGISGAELAAFTGSDNYYLERIERDRPDLAETVRSYAWLSESASRNTGSRGAGLLASPLLDDGLTDYERSALSSLYYISRYDEALGQRVAGWPWLADGVTKAEAQALMRLQDTIRKDLPLARKVIGFSWLADNQVTDSEVLVLDFFLVLSVHSRNEPELKVMAELLADQPWFQDSITAREGAAVSVMRSGCTYLSHCRQLIENPQIESQTLALPFGEVNLHLISRSPLGADADTIFQEGRRAMTFLEEFMEEAWGVADFPIYVEPKWQYIHHARGFYRLGSHRDSILYSAPYPPLVMIADAAEIDVLYHELAHHYSHRGTRWLIEGGATFFDGYIEGGEGALAMRLEVLNRRYADEGCDGAKNIHERNLSTGWMPHSMWLSIRTCDYLLGERFLLALYVNLGHEMVAASLQELHRGTNFSGGNIEEFIYQVMLSHVPPGREADFQELYDRYHGRPRGYVHQPPPAIGDRGVLIALYNATGGPEWERQRLWLTDAPIAVWQGVHTAASDVDRAIDRWKGEDHSGGVFSLDLSHNKLSGPIPPELGDLANLEGLGLSSNQLSGPIPPELGDLANLEGLGLSSNQLSGPIPAELGNLGKLSRLDLTGNQLSGPIPAELGNLGKLSRLDLTGNQLSGPIPPEIGNLANLRDLNLGTNQLSGPIPPELGNLANLVEFLLGGNQLTGPVPRELGNLRELLWFSLAENQLTGRIPDELANLSGLTILNLGNNQLTGEIPPSLGSLSRLERLLLNDNRLTGVIPPELGSLAELEIVRLWGNGFTGCVPAPLVRLMDQFQFQEIGLPACGDAVQPVDEPGGSPEDDLATLMALFRDLDGPNWGPGTGGPDGAWTSDNPVRNWFGVEVDGFGRVSRLSLPALGIAGVIPPELGELTALRELRLNNNEFNGDIPTELGNLTNLESLDLGHNLLTGEIPPELGNLTRLRTLDLSENQLGGSIPPALGNLINLERLLLHNNQLVGAVPAELGNLTKLGTASDPYYAVNIDGNQLTGCWPNGLPEARTLPTCAGAGVSPGGDADVLLSIHYAAGAGGDGRTQPGIRAWNHAASAGLPISEWHGVVTNDDGRVVELYVSSETLMVPIPPEIGLLTELEVLSLNDSGFTGPIPPELGNLTRLTVLVLSKNQLTGSIPPELANLKNLRALRLERNRLTGPIPPWLGSLENLETLELGDNELTGCIPPPVPDSRAFRDYACR